MSSLLRLVFVLFCFLTVASQAQVLELSYHIKQGAGLADDTLRIFLQSKSNDTIGIRAVSLSVAFDGGPQNLQGYHSEFVQLWTPVFQADRTDSVSLQYLGKTFSHRWNYGIGDRNVSPNSIMQVPPDTALPLKVMEVFFENLSPGMVYVESQSENPVNQIGDDGFSQLSYCVLALPGTFPVTWSFFDATNIDNGAVKLQWATATEINNSRFEIERSDEIAFGNFNTLGEVAGNGNSTEEVRYQFFDASFGIGRMYYRIRQIDFDGGFSFSNIISVEKKAGIFSMKTGPSPARNDFHIYLEGVPKEGLSLAIFDQKGIRIKHLDLSNPDGKQVTITVASSGLAEGVYLVRAQQYTDPSVQLMSRIVVVR
jgi:hypothetical protein